MCQVIDMSIDNRTIRVADIKKKFIPNIVDAAKKCDYIDKIILFGSCIDDRCTEESDIDLAVFGNKSRGRCLTSKKYERFLTQIYSYDDFSQAYDILYFKTGQKNNSPILDDIDQGEVLYEVNK